MSQSNLYQFYLFDYVVFSGMLLLSALTGIYFAYRHKLFKTSPTNLRAYLTGERKMKPFPVAMSLVASYVSGVTMLGTPAEIYNFGSMYWMIVFAIWISGLVIGIFYLPVFVRLQVYSSYEYLEFRFGRIVRTIVSVFFVLDEIMFLPIVIYVPSLAFNQVTGINLHIVGTIVCLICVFYTVLGGLRAVVYTDTWQILTMFAASVLIVILGTINVGGVGKVVQTAIDGGRLTAPNFSPSLYERYTFFSVVFGGFIYWTSFNSVNQTMVQRYMSLPTEFKSELSLFLFIIGVSSFVSICCYSGLLLYATYHDCDPLTAGRIHSDDQMLPLFVMETVGYLKGIPGLFIAGVFGAALSSLSVIFNSTSIVVLEDILKSCWHIHYDEIKSKRIAKGVVLVLGALSIGFLYIVEHLGSVLAVATQLSAIASGTTFGIFTLGMMVPWANTKGAIYGGISGFIVAAIISYGSQVVNAFKQVVPHKLPVSIDQCFNKYGIHANSTDIVYPDESAVFPLFRLSYLWVTPIGTLTVILVGILVSFLTGPTELMELDPDLITPFIRRFLPKECERNAGSALKRVRNSYEENTLMETELSLPEVSTISTVRI